LEDLDLNERKHKNRSSGSGKEGTDRIYLTQNKERWIAGFHKIWGISSLAEDLLTDFSRRILIQGVSYLKQPN